MAHTKKTFINSLSFNKTISLLTLSDIFTWGLYMVIANFVGLYLERKFGDSAIELVGIGTSIFFLARVVTQVPIGIVTDRIKKDRDDIFLLIIGNVLMGVPYFFFPYINSALEYYLIQFVIGIGGAMNLVNWRKLFAANLEEGKSGLTYGLYDSILSFTMIIYGIVAGFVAGISSEYFDKVMIAVGILMTLSGIWPLLIFTVRNRISRNK
jgi:MFS family permease